MPLEIIRNDITKVKADAIVNTANPEVGYGPRVDGAIYDAAGAEDLLKEREKIGRMSPGEAAVTPAFRLMAKYIIHTVGPEWRGGEFGEEETVTRCYRNSLALAKEKGCESVAFPLISTGTYGFPKDKALKIAISEISDFLLKNDMTIFLVVYDREAFVLSGKLFDDVKEYIDDHYIEENGFSLDEEKSSLSTKILDATKSEITDARESERRSKFAKRRRGRRREENGSEYKYGAPVLTTAEPMADYSVSSEVESGDLEEKLRNRGKTFQEQLFRIIDKKGLGDVEVYKKANIDRKLFSKIKSNVNYNPSKRTALAFAIALELNLDETLDLLRSAGMTLSDSSKFDVIIGFCIESGMKDINDVNCLLFKYGEQTLGA